MWAILILASLLVLIVFAFSVPLDVVLRIDVCGRPKFRMRLAWLFGLVSREITKKEKETKYYRTINLQLSRSRHKNHIRY